MAEQRTRNAQVPGSIPGLGLKTPKVNPFGDTKYGDGTKMLSPFSMPLTVEQTTNLTN